MLWKARGAAVAAHQAKELEAGDGKQPAGCRSLAMRLEMRGEPFLDGAALIEQLVRIFDERLARAHRALEARNGQITVGEVRGGKGDGFRRTQAVPEGDEQEDPVAFARSPRLAQQANYLITREMFHLARTKMGLPDYFPKQLKSKI